MYIINGALTLSGGSPLNGTGVTFYIPAGGSVNFNGGSTFNLTAPTTGTYNGILFYQDRSNSTAGTISGGSTSTLQGILYFPKAPLTWSGGSASGTYTSVVAGSLTFSGGSRFQNYANVNSATPISGAELVE